MGFGLTIRKIREKKGLTQRKVCFDIVTMSYYSRIERDISDPSITIFLKILSRLNITFDEFMFIHNNYTELTEDFFWFNISELYHSNNIEELKRIKSDSNLKDIENKDLIPIIDLFIGRLSGNDLNFDKNAPLINRLMKIEHWSTEEVKIFTSTMDLFPIEILIILVNNILKKRTLYMKSKGYNSPYSKILINSVLLCVNKNHLSAANKYLDTYRSSLEVRDFFGKTMSLYLEGLILYKENDYIRSQEKMNKFFLICELLDKKEFSHKYKEYFDRIKNKMKSTY